jgi:protein phosphatase
VNVDAFGQTDTGKVRSNNEDHFVVGTLQRSMELQYTSLDDLGPIGKIKSPVARFLVVADGVGGRPDGELASGAAVQSILHYIAETAGCFRNFDETRENEFLQRLEAGVQRAHELIQHDLGGPAGAPSTTLTMATLVGPRAYILHVGDSRAYHLHAGRLRQLTRDQTMGNFMVDAGAWTEAQAARAKFGGNLTSTVGGAEMASQIAVVDLEPGDLLMLCSDGLTNHVDDAGITAFLGRPDSAESICKALVASALEAGGTDNVTVVVARMQ